MPYRPFSGFTLIELSVVLVIIGLIIGGILIGRDMILSAEIRADISEIEKINTAVTTFKLKYNCLPGDCEKATALFGTGPFGHLNNGDGNGLIRSYMNSANTSQTAFDPVGTYLFVINDGWSYWRLEWFSMFDHLSTAGLYAMAPYDEGTPLNPNAANNIAGKAYPAMRWQHGGADPLFGGGMPSVPGGITAGYEVDGNYLHMGTCYTTFYGITSVTFFCGYTALAARQFDSKIDDGLPLSGAVRATDPVYFLRSATTSPAGGPTANCVSGTEYTSGDAYRSCPLRLKAAF